ncbi:MAG: discoidin domain-containing protein [Verrucomicrobiota bacterium]
METTVHPFGSLFDDAAVWQVFASGQAEGHLSAIADPHGQSRLRLDYDFHGGGGFVVIRRLLRFTLPETFEIGFQLRGEGPPNHFELKVADPGGANVWRHLRPDFRLPTEWTGIDFHERDLPFAWGPAGGGAPSEVEAIELVIAAGPGGRGSLELGCPYLVDQTLGAPHAIHASSQQPGFPPAAVFAAGTPAEWRAAPDDAHPWWSADFGRRLRFGGLVIQWPQSLAPRECAVELSDDGSEWTRVFHAAAALGSSSYIPTPGAEARQLRISFGNAACAALLSLTLRPDAFSRTPNEFIHCVAADFPRGWFPRYWLREQSYWTPVGSPQGKRRALINEEGIVEVDEAGFSLEPFILTGGRRLTWADVTATVSLPEGGAPMPAVTWNAAGLQLEILPWVDGQDDRLTLHVTYRLRCRQPVPDTRLVVAVRPFQVNPPWQAFRNLGGRSPIHHIRGDARGMTVNDRELSVTPTADAFGAAAFEEGGVLTLLASGTMPPHNQVDDESGLASAALAWVLPPGQSTVEITVSVPYFGIFQPSVTDSRANALADWRQTLGAVQWRVPACAAPAFDAFRTAAGHILINRDGPAIQPGPRRYTRSWVRDCVIMGAALAKAGLPAALREFVIWYAQFQRADGFVPCVVDRDGIDWLVEHDSHGQFLWGIREVFRDGGDRQLLETLFPHARRAADYLIGLRAERQTDAYRTGEHSACFGLLPESASHEGYLAHPVHSYWDDFWGVRGLQAAADLAAALGLTADCARWQREAGDFQHDLLASLNQVIAAKKLTYIPGSVEWADFDPTASANAIAQLDFADVLPRDPLLTMLDTYLDGFHRKHRGQMPWLNYTAYEIRIIGAFTRLGKRDQANELLEFFLSDQRPPAWNQWPEITWRDPRSPGHLGDVPHTWIAAEYLLALAAMVASEREASASMVLASGMPWAWISQESGFAVTGLPTRFGTLDFAISASGEQAIHLEVGGTLTLPPGGLSISPPLPPDRCIAAAICSNGTSLAIGPCGTSVIVPMLPFLAELSLAERVV